MFLEICMQIHSVVFALNRQINKLKVRENSKSVPCFSIWVGEIKPFYRLDPPLSTFSIKAGCELFRLEVGIYTTLSKQECIVALVAITVPSGDVQLTASTKDRLPCGTLKQLAEGGVCYIQIGGGVLEWVSSDSVRLVKCSQRAFRKFHLNTGLAVRGSIGFIGCINDDLCWDFGKGSRMVRCGNCPARFS